MGFGLINARDLRVCKRGIPMGSTPPEGWKSSVFREVRMNLGLPSH